VRSNGSVVSLSGSCPGDRDVNSPSERSAGDNPSDSSCNPLGCGTKRGDSGTVLEP